MNALTIAPTTIICGKNKFKKFGKKMNQKTKKDLNKITETLKKISDDEIKRAQDLYLEHKNFIRPNENKTTEKIDFYDM